MEKKFDILLLVTLLSFTSEEEYTVEPPVSSKKILMLSIHSMLPWKRLKATLPIYVNRRGEKQQQKNKDGRKTDRSIL